MRALACIAVLTLAAVAAVPAAATPGFQRGFVLAGWRSDSYLQPSSDASILRMSSDGSDHAAVFTQWFLATPTSSRVAPDAARTPSDAALLHAMASARAAGMQVTLKPQVSIRSGAWIGEARPADPAAFWASYRAMLLHYADLARLGGASMLVIGTEMVGLSGDENHWRTLIAELRTHFSGALTYAANYDEYQRVPFWNALDYIGIDAYFPLAGPARPQASAADLATAWTARGHLAAIGDFSRRIGRKVIFTELGYRGTRTSAVQPNVWDTVGQTDLQEQANAYQAFYDAVADQPWLAGVYWWAVTPDSWWAQDYSPLGKPAERVMAAANLGAAPPAPIAPRQFPAGLVDGGGRYWSW